MTGVRRGGRIASSVEYGRCQDDGYVVSVIEAVAGR